MRIIYPSAFFLVLSAGALQAGEPQDVSMTTAVSSLLGPPVLQEGLRGHEQVKSFLRKRIPKLELPPDAAAWTKRAQEIRQNILSEVILKGVPADVVGAKPEVRWGQTVKTGNGYVIRKLAYEGYPGLWIPALLYEPEILNGRTVGVLNLKGHEPEGKAVPYEQVRCINLAKRGMIALSPDWLGFGQLRGRCQDDNGPHNNLTYLDLCGQNGVSVFFLCARRGLDVLLDHPNVNPQQAVVTGLSGGGWRTIVLSSLDTRVSMAVPVAGYTILNSRIDLPRDVGDKEQNPTDMEVYGDYSHLTALMAPRPALLIYNARDFFNPSQTRPGIYNPVLQFYKLYGREKDFGFHVNESPGDHNYLLDNRQAFYRFLNDHFPPPGKREDAEINSDKEVLSEEALRVDLPKDSLTGDRTWVVLGSKAMEGLPKIQPLPAEAGARNRWCADLRRRLQQTIRYKPLVAAVAKSKQLQQTAVSAGTVVYQVGEEWMLPAVEFSPEKPGGTTLLISDGGKSKSSPLAAGLIASGQRVVVADILFTGELTPGWQFAQMVEAVGERPLGIKVAQIIAIRDILAKQNPAGPITMVGDGSESSVAVLLAAGIAGKGDQVITLGLPGSLKDLITKGGSYAKTPSLFCFGLLETTDIEHLIQLAGPERVSNSLDAQKKF